jgi:hypothetical protein
MVLTALLEAMGSYPLPTAYFVEYSGGLEPITVESLRWNGKKRPIFRKSC